VIDGQSILALLPQTQCTRCGYPDCESYANAIVDGVALINQCPPGGEAGIQRLAQLSGQPALPLNPDNGLEGPRSVVWIDEAWCIGCTLCIDACPVDAIIGTHKRMHTVIEQDCTGCELCVPVCPVDCIELENVSGTATGWDAWSATQAENARQRYAARQQRLQETAPIAPVEPLPQQKISRVEAALIRAQQRAEQNKND
jgi:electron transport complex protein RnfB